MCYSAYFVAFWPCKFIQSFPENAETDTSTGRSSTLAGTTGTAFTLAFQSSVGQVGGVIGPQLFQEKWAYNGYKTSFGICAAAIIASWACNLWTWWLTRNIEWDVLRVRRLRIQAEKAGEVLSNDDVRYFDERQFYGGLHKRNGDGATS
jgi:hypothetical protein